MAINNNLDKKIVITYALIMELLLDLKKNVIPYSQKFNFLSSEQIILNKIIIKIIH